MPFAVHIRGEGSEPTYVLEGREALTPVFADLHSYGATTHFNAQSTVTIDGDRAAGESYTIAHHLFSENGNRKIMIASLRYLDTFAKIDGSWYFAERKLLLDWSETRPSTPGTRPQTTRFVGIGANRRHGGNERVNTREPNALPVATNCSRRDRRGTLGSYR
jgi:hypothetical protein